MQAKIFVSERSETQRNAAVVEELEQTRQCIRCFAEQELARRRERQERAEAKEAQELDLRRKLDQDRKAVREQVAREASRRFKVNRGEFKKKGPDSKPVQTEVAKSDRGAQPSARRHSRDESGAGLGVQRSSLPAVLQLAGVAGRPYNRQGGLSSEGYGRTCSAALPRSDERPSVPSGRAVPGLRFSARPRPAALPSDLTCRRSDKRTRSTRPQACPRFLI